MIDKPYRAAQDRRCRLQRVRRKSVRNVGGAAVGAFLSGYVSDRFGHRITLSSLALVFVAGAIGAAVAPNVEIMIAIRLLLAIAVGGGSSTVPVFIAEIAGSRYRAPL